MGDDDLDLGTIWAVLTQDSRTGKWKIRSVHKTEQAATMALDRETLRVVELECSPVGWRDSMFAALASAHGTGKEGEG